MSDAELDRTLQALADPTRRAVIELLRAEPQRAGDLAKRLEIAPAGLSRHLRVLRRAGLVSENTSKEDARVRLYELESEPFDELSSWLDEVQAYWQGQLASFKAHAEGGKRRRKT